MIAPTTTLDLTSLTADVSGVNVGQYTISRVYPSVQGFDDVTGDSLGNADGTTDGLGFAPGTNGDSFPEETQTIPLDVPAPNAGGNIAAGDFQNLTDTTVTFDFPWIDFSTFNTRFGTLDNLTLDGDATVIPEPAALGGLFGLAALLIARRRA